MSTTQLAQLEESVAAVASGEIGFAHFAHIANTSAAVGERLDESTLLRHARRESVAKFRDTCIHARHAADPKGVAEDEAKGVEARCLTITNTDDGMVAVSGMLDKVGGAVLRTALEPLATRAGKDDHRLFPRRLGDALVELAEGSMKQPQIQVTSSVETLLGLVGAPAAEMEFALPISSKTVERFARRDPRPARLRIDGYRRWALQANCVGSGAPSARCPRRPLPVARLRSAGETERGAPPDALDLWWLDQPRQPDSFVCHRHHWMAHEGGWQIVRSDDGPHADHPAGHRIPAARARAGLVANLN